MATDPASDVLRWVQEGERLFGETLQTLQHCREVELTAATLARENQRLQDELRLIQEEVHRLRSERLEAAETLRAIAQQVTQLATAALQRLGKPVA